MNVIYSKLHAAVCLVITNAGAVPEAVLARINTEISEAERDEKGSKTKVAVKTTAGAKASYAVVRTTDSAKSAKLAITPALRIAEISDLCFGLAEKFCRVDTITLPKSVEDWLREVPELKEAPTTDEKSVMQVK